MDNASTARKTHSKYTGTGGGGNGGGHDKVFEKQPFSSFELYFYILSHTSFALYRASLYHIITYRLYLYK